MLLLCINAERSDLADMLKLRSKTTPTGTVMKFTCHRYTSAESLLGVSAPAGFGPKLQEEQLIDYCCSVLEASGCRGKDNIRYGTHVIDMLVKGLCTVKCQSPMRALAAHLRYQRHICTACLESNVLTTACTVK